MPLNDPESTLEKLVPEEVKKNDPDLTYRRYDVLSEYTEEEIDNLCVNWNLTTSRAKSLKKIWRNHPDRDRTTEKGNCILLLLDHLISSIASIF